MGRLTPQSAIDGWGQKLNAAGAAMIPPPTALRPELTDGDVAWLNGQMALTGRPPVQFAREIPIPALPSGVRPAPPTGWITMTEVRG